MASRTGAIGTRAVLESTSKEVPQLLGVAVLGTGSIGMRHLKVLAGLEGVRPVAVPTRQDRLAELERAGFATAEGLVAAVRTGATLCIIATETGRHLEDGLAAIDLGLEVLMEKPLAATAREANRLASRAREAQRTITVGCVLRFSESLNLFRERLPEIGRVHAVRIECQSYLPSWRPDRPYLDSYSARAGEGGVLRDLIHEIDYAGWLFGWPSSVEARLRNLGRLGIEAEETADLLWETPEGCAISISLDYLSQPSRRRMSASGERGTLEWNGIEGSVTLALAGAPARVMESAQSRDEMYAAQAQVFLNNRLGLREPRQATVDDGVKALAVCDAARFASESRREVRVNYP